MIHCLLNWLFFYSVATEFEAFLREYQTDVLLIPFLFEDLTNLMLQVMKRFILKDNLKMNPLRLMLRKYLITCHATKLM